MTKGGLRSLTERQKARDKVSVFFGSKDNFYHPFIEIVLNSVDEISNNFENGNIKVKLHEDNETISVLDSGRGLPLLGKTDGVENYQLLLLKLFAGTNYDNNEIGKVATGTNGVGLTVTNYCSTFLEAKSIRDGKCAKVTFVDGGKMQDMKVVECNYPSCTEITFKLDKEVFQTLKYNAEEMKDVLKRISGVNEKVAIDFIHNGQTHSFHYDTMEEYFYDVATNRTSAPAIGRLKEYKEQNETNRIELIIATAVEPLQQSFLNSTFLKEGGKIDDGVLEGTRDVVNKYCETKKLFPNKNKKITTGDVQDSITYVCKFLSTNVEFANQTKFSTRKDLYRKLAKKYTKETLEAYMAEQPKEFEKFVKHILDVHKFNEKSSASRKALQKKLSEKVTDFTRVEGLVDCKTHGENAELFICEGKSALGSVVLARDPKFQAAMAIRGKIMNCLKASLNEILNSPIITDLIKVLGCGIETNKKNSELGQFDMSKLRYGKIMITADADVDGAHIVCLILTMLYKLMPKIIEEGLVYVVNTPLFEIQDNKTKEYFYAFSEQEKEEILAKIPNKVTINRNKGLGEVNPNTMAMCINSEKRNLTRITPDTAERMSKIFEVWMSKEVNQRKDIINNTLDQYVDFE